MLPSEHDMTGTHIDSYQWWLPVEDLNKIKPVKIPAWMRRDCLGSIPIKGYAYW